MSTTGQPVALSLFPGLGVLDMAFQDAGWCVVRGPDVVWQGDVRGWSVPEGVFDGVFGGPPCQTFSPLSTILRATGREPKHGNLIPEFERIVAGARPRWFVMENVPEAPFPVVEGYDVWSTLIKDYEVGGIQLRERRFSLGFRDGWTGMASPWTLLRYDLTAANERIPTVAKEPVKGSVA